MPVYGLPGVEVEYTYIAVKPITAEHPIGSGIMRTFQPGEEFPGEDWGMAAFNLVEVGKAVRLAVNIHSLDGDDDSDVVPVEPSVLAAIQTEAREEGVTSYPLHEGAGWYTLSNGERVRGKESALAAEAELWH